MDMGAAAPANGEAGMPPIRVAIVGAGLTGLLAAQGLKMNGFHVAVFDSERTLGARNGRDWTIVLHWAMDAMKRLLPAQLLESGGLDEALCNPHLHFDESVECLPCFNGLTGDVLFRSPLPHSKRVSRHRLRQVLARGLEDEIRWGKRLVGLEERAGGAVALTFEAAGRAEDGLVQEEKKDREVFEADFVLGTDGASSKVRELLLGGDKTAAQTRPSGFMFATGIVNYGDADKVEAVLKAHPVAAIMMGMEAVSGCGVMSVGDPGDKATWTTFWVKIWRGSAADIPGGREGQAAIDHIKATTQNLCEPFQSLVDWTPDGSTCYIDEMKYWVPVPFDNRSGRVTLAGDAAHPMLIYRGQGFQHAITDAVNYVDALLKIRDEAAGPVKREDIMNAYDSEMIARTAEAVRQSLHEAELSMNPDTVGKMLMATKGHGRSA